MSALDRHRLGHVGANSIESVRPSFDFELVELPRRQHGSLLLEMVGTPGPRSAAGLALLWFEMLLQEVL